MLVFMGYLLSWLVYFRLYLCYLDYLLLDYLICSLVGSGKGFFVIFFRGLGVGVLNKVGDLCPIVKHLYLYDP